MSAPRAKTVAAPSREDALTLYRLMALARRFEQRLGAVFADGRLAGWFHSCEGQEATGATFALCLEPEDHLVPYHRSRSSLFAKGMTPLAVAAELMARATAESRGRGGDGHIVAPGRRIYGMSGVLGASIPIATGIAYASKLRGTREVTVNAFGEGTTNRGAFHEALNLAAIWDLPVVFVCENNLYVEFSPASEQMRVADVATRAAAYGIPGQVVDGNDPDAVLAVMSAAVQRARDGYGPTLVEAKTYRHGGHYDGDPQGYRSREEVAEWVARDPVAAYRSRLLKRGHADEKELAALEAALDDEVAAAMEKALAAPLATAEDVRHDVYAEPAGMPT